MDKERESFSWHVVTVMQRMIYERQLTDAEVIRNAPVNRASFYARMHGRAPFNTDEIARIIRYLGVSPGEFLRALATSLEPATSVANGQLDEAAAPAEDVMKRLLASELEPLEQDALRSLLRKLDAGPNA